MAKYASGKHAFAISDRSGQRYLYRNMRREWNGLLVGPDEYEPKHPQLGPFRKVDDPQALRDARPESNLTQERAIQYGFFPVGFRDIEGITPPNNLIGTGNVGQVAIQVTSGTPTSTSVTVSLTGAAATSAIASVTATGNVTVYAVTVSSYYGANKYYIDGTRQATLTLSEGNTYRLDQSDSSNSGHPLRFSTTSDGSHGGGSEYTTGVTTSGTPGSAGAYTQITVASGAPTLYYYCTNHSGMGGQANTP